MTVNRGPAGRTRPGVPSAPPSQRTLKRISIATAGVDVINQAGVAGLVKHESDIETVPPARMAQADVVVFVTPRLNGRTLQHLRRLQSTGAGRFVLVLEDLGDGDWVAAAELGVAGVIWRSTITPRGFVTVVRAVAEGSCMLPPDVQARLLDDIAQLQRTVLTPRGLTAAGLDQREIDLLRLIADGLSTVEIAQQMQYSERMVKKILAEMMARLDLRNRTHAVAFAMRSGLL